MTNSTTSELALPLLFGIVLHVPLYYGVHWISHVAATSAQLGPAPLWYVFSYPLLWATAATVPGFVAGWLSRTHAFVLGAAIGFVSSLIEQPVIDLGWSGGTMSWLLIARIAAYALGPAIVSAMACAAGLHARGAPANAPLPPPPAAAPGKTKRR